MSDPQPEAAQASPEEHTRPSTADADHADHSGQVRRLEANSGAAFVRKLGLRIDPAKAPKLNLFGWNVGMRPLPLQHEAITSLVLRGITSLEHMKGLAQVYFDKVDPCYGFIDRHQFFERLDARWQSTAIVDRYDCVLAGVAALGCLFSLQTATVTEVRLVHAACTGLSYYNFVGPPSLDHMTGVALRIIYLRMTDTPHATWSISCNLMHLIEAAGLHPERSNDSILPHSVQFDPDLRKRLVGIAHHLNVWTSFDLGLTRVSFQSNDLPLPPSPRPGDYTGEILGLLPVSVSLDPGSSKETDLTSTLSKLLDSSHTQPPSVLAQSNLVLCILRRIHTQNLDISPTLAARILTLLKKALACARELVQSYSPWHHVVNVPFHIICVLLVMDTRSSLTLLPEAMQTLRLVNSTYDTLTTREAYNTARLLVMLHQQRRMNDITVLGAALSNSPHAEEVEPPPYFHSNSDEYSWLGALVADLPGLQRVDLDQFLNSDLLLNSDFLCGTG